MTAARACLRFANRAFGRVKSISTSQSAATDASETHFDLAYLAVARRMSKAAASSSSRSASTASITVRPMRPPAPATATRSARLISRAAGEMTSALHAVELAVDEEQRNAALFALAALGFAPVD